MFKSYDSINQLSIEVLLEKSRQYFDYVDQLKATKCRELTVEGAIIAESCVRTCAVGFDGVDSINNEGGVIAPPFLLSGGRL